MLDTPEKTLQGFMYEMHAWETRCSQRDKECAAGRGDFKTAARQGMVEYMHIFERYCSKTRAEPRDTFCYTDPPEYDPDGEMILAVTHAAPDAVQIRTRQNYGFKDKNVYTLFLENGEWRIVQKKVESVAEAGKLLEANL